MFDNLWVLGGAIAVFVGLVWLFIWWRKRQDARTADRRELSRIRRTRIGFWWATLVALTFSAIINQAHAPSREPIVVGIASWAPVAIYICVELMSKVPEVDDFKWAKWAFHIVNGLAVLAAVALSYARMWISIHEFGFSRWESFLYPITFDGPMVGMVIGLTIYSRLQRKLEIKEYGAAVTQLATAEEVAETVAEIRAVKAEVSVGRSGPRGDYGPQGEEYSEGHQRARGRAGKPRTAAEQESPKPRKRTPRKATRPTETSAPSLSDVAYGPRLPEGDYVVEPVLNGSAH